MWLASTHSGVPWRTNRAWLRILRTGGFAVVQKCHLIHKALDFKEEVAVKRLKPEVLKGPNDLKEFLLEANLLRKLRHP